MSKLCTPGPDCEVPTKSGNVCFSNRPIGSSAFRPSTSTCRCRSRGRASLRESAPGPFHHGFRGRGQEQSVGGLPVLQTAGPSRHTNSPSLIGRLRSSAFRPSTSTVSMSLAGPCFSRNRHQGPSIMGFEDGAEQSAGRPCRITDSRSKQTYELAFSNRPIEVKRFQTIHHHSVDVARGVVLLFGIGARALPSWVSRTGRNNLLGGLAVLQTAGPSRHTNSPHPSSRKGHHSTAPWSSNVLLSCWIRHSSHAAAATCSRVHRNSVPSTQMRCMITANRRASATIAFFDPALPGDLHGPGLEPAPLRQTHQHDMSRFVEHRPHHLVPAP